MQSRKSKVLWEKGERKDAPGATHEPSTVGNIYISTTALVFGLRLKQHINDEDGKPVGNFQYCCVDIEWWWAVNVMDIILLCVEVRKLKGRDVAGWSDQEPVNSNVFFYPRSLIFFLWLFSYFVPYDVSNWYPTEMVEIQCHVCMMAGELRCIAAVVPPQTSHLLKFIWFTSSSDHRAALQYLVLCFIKKGVAGQILWRKRERN